MSRCSPHRALAAITSAAAALVPAGAGSVAAQAPVAAPAVEGVRIVDFDRDIRPILSDKCFRCHGPDARHRKAELRLDTRAGAFAERADGRRVIVPGDPASSEIVRRITHEDPEERMPKAGSGLTLSDAEIELVIDWVAQGAEWKEHWAFAPIAQPDVPPVGDRGDWPRNEIDHFVLARLDAEALAPSPPADRRTLARRVAFDLTGMPPDPAVLRAFLRDESPDAYDRLVDELLDSPRYGEHMARFWLDAARYGDTHGLHLDNYREMWPYRDWVIGAFNANMPFDQFTLEQLAGDLLPDATLEQQIASGFNRCHVTTNEGGSIREEVYVRNVIDRASTAGTVFLGLSIGCAVCHDHKFDPISQAEFYQLFAFFNNLDADPMDGNAKVHAPFVQVPTPEQAERIAGLRRDIAAIEDEIAVALRELEYEDPGEVPPHAERERHVTVWIDDELPGADETVGELVWVDAAAAPVHSGVRSMKRVSQGNQQHYFKNAARKLRIGAGDVLFAWVWLDPVDPPREIMLQFNSDGGDGGWKHRAYWGENLIDYGADGTTQRIHLGDLPAAGEWHKLEVAAAEVGLRPGMVVHGMAFTQFDGTAYWDSVGIASSVDQDPVDFAWIDDDVPSGANLAGDGKTWQWVGGDEHPVHSGLRSLRRSGGDRLNQDYFTKALPLKLQSGDVLFAHVWLDPEDPPRSVQLQFNNGNWEHRARWGDPAHGAGRKNGADFVAGALPALGEWVRLEVELDDVDLQPDQKLNGWAFTQVGGAVFWDRAGVRTWGPPDDRYLVSQRAWERIAADDDQVPESVREAARIEPPARSDAARQLVRDHYLRYVYSGTRQAFDGLESRFAELNRQLSAVDKDVATTLVMNERDEPRAAFVLERGQYDARGEQVERATPAALPPMDPELPKNRLGLARWLLDPEHPLTARVTVNRFWQQVFGTGIVKTVEDFGNQGERPGHPALLDWLAKRFVQDGFDVKQLMKRLVTSATYRQASKISPELYRRDPENRLLARGPRYRLDAEMLRDQALAVSGLLVEQVGGPSVKPPQPDGLWFAVGYSGSNTVRFKRDTGPDKVYRRGLYTFWKRTAPPPQMSTFDAPSREDCVVRRERTNTPLQALLLMNDPQYVEAARHLAERMIEEGGSEPRARAAWAFELLTCRVPSASDLADALALYESERAEFARDPDSAKALLAVGDTAADPSLDPVETAAWTLVANLFLNLDEVITKH